MATKGQVTLDEAATIDKRLLTVTRLEAADTVHSETFVLVDPDGNDTAEFAKVVNAAPSTEYGLVVRNIPSGTQAISHASLAVTGGGVEASALRVTIASDSTGVLTVDGTVTANAGTGNFTV